MAYPNAKVIRSVIDRIVGSSLSDSRFSSALENGVKVQDVQAILESMASEIGDEDGLADLNSILVDDNLVAAINSILTRLASTADGYGASLIGVEDVAGYFAGSDVESVLAELHEAIVGSDSLQEAYEIGNEIVTDSTNGHVIVSGDQKLVIGGSANLQAQNDVDVYGSVTIGVDLDVDGVSNLENVDIDGTTDMQGVVDMHSGLDMNNTDIDFIKDLDVDGIVDVEGAADFASTVDIHGNTVIKSGADFTVEDDEDNVVIGTVSLGSHSDPSGADIIGVQDNSVNFTDSYGYITNDNLPVSGDVQDAIEHIRDAIDDITIPINANELQNAAQETFVGQISDSDTSPSYTEENYVSDGDSLNLAIDKIDQALADFAGSADLQTTYDNSVNDGYGARILVNNAKPLTFLDDNYGIMLELDSSPAGAVANIQIGDANRDDNVKIYGNVEISDTIKMYDTVLIQDAETNPTNYVNISPTTGDIQLTGSLLIDGSVVSIDATYTDADHMLISPDGGVQWGLALQGGTVGYSGNLIAVDVYGDAYGDGDEFKVMANGDFYVDNYGPFTGSHIELLTDVNGVLDADSMHFHKASNITAIDNFDNSDSVNVQDVLEDFDTAITNTSNNITWDNVYANDPDGLAISTHDLFFDIEDGYGFYFRDSVNASIALFTESAIDFYKALDMNSQNINSINDIDINGDADIEGNVAINLTLDVEGAVDFNSTLDVHDDAQFYADLDVDGYGIFGDDVTLESGANLDLVAGNITLANSYTVDGRDVSVDGQVLDDHVADDVNSKHDADQIDFEYADGSKIVIQAASDTVEEALRDLDTSIGDTAGNASLNNYSSNNYVVNGYGVIDAISKLDAALSATDNQKLYHMQVSDSSGGAVIDFGDAATTQFFVVTASNSEEYKSGTLKIFVDGILQIPTTDYTEDGDNDGFTFTYTPTATQQIRVEFEKNN